MVQENIILDHADIVTSHICNMRCPFCIDKFIRTSTDTIKLEDVHRFMKLLRKHTDEPLEILLLGGEPTMLSKDKLVKIAETIHEYGFKAMMSTNGVLTDKIKQILPYYDWVQITVHSDKELKYWSQWPEKVNVKLSGDRKLTFDKLIQWIEDTKQFERRSVSMYFTEDFEELCKDKDIWNLLETLDWKRNGSYLYAFYEGVRFKRCIHGETNIIDEPTVPKLYPNGNYNKTWRNEDMDAYLGNL